VTPTLLGGWSLIREWGRIGSPGRVKASTFESEEDARQAERRGIRKRQLHGYRADQDIVSSWAGRMAAGGKYSRAGKAGEKQVKNAPLLGKGRTGHFGLSEYLKKLDIIGFMRLTDVSAI
jgi:predicted DNA-binding WGR domain protein